MNRQIIIDYDRRFDVLYVDIKEKSNSYGDESQNDILIRRDFGSNEITGFTVFDFMKKLKTNSLPIIPKELGMSFGQDIIPLIIN